MRSNKVEYSTATGMYCTMHDVKGPFNMQQFSSSMIIYNCFHANNGKGDSGMGCDILVGHDLMIQIGTTENFKRQVIQLDGDTVHMN